MDAARAAVSEAFGDRALATLIFHDVAVFYYSCLAWRQKAFTKPDAAAFAYHKESSWFYLMLMVCKLLILEGVAVHFLLQEWSHQAAWLVSASHVYLIILLVADYNAMRLNPVLVDQAGVRIRYGLRISADVPFSEIANVTVAQGMEIPKEEWETTVGPMFEQPNTAIELAQPLKVRGLFGIRREVGKIYLTLDKPEQFRQMIGEKTMYTRMI